MAAERNEPFFLCESVLLSWLESVFAVELDGFIFVFQDSGEARCVLLGDESGGFFRSRGRGFSFDREAKIAAVFLRSPCFQLSGVELGWVNAEQADEGVAGEYIEINVRERLKLVFCLGGR